MMKSKSEKTFIYILLIICSAIYLSLVWNTNVWMDEAFTASLAHNSFLGVLYFSMMDTLPPLYNIILKISTSIFGYTIPVMKITSCIPMIATMYIAATTLRKRLGQVTAASFMMLITLMPLMLYFGVEIRMYSLGFFFTTASGIFAYEVLCESTKKNWTKFIIFSVLAGYSHHFAFLTVGFIYLFLLLYYFFADRKHIVRWFKCLGFTFLLYLPCLIVTLMQFSRVSGYFSMPDVTLALFIQYVLYPFMVGKITASILCLLFVASIIIYFLYKYFKGIDRSICAIYSFYCFLVYYGVLVFGTIISKIMTANIFVDRYLFFSTGLLWLFVAIQIGKLPGKIKYIAFVAIIYIGICTYIVEYNVEYTGSSDEEIEFIENNVTNGDILYAVGGHEEMENCLPFLSKLTVDSQMEYMVPLNNAIQVAVDRNATLWVSVLDGYTISPEELAILDAYGYTLEKASDFEFDRYKCEFYKAVQK